MNKPTQDLTNEHNGVLLMLQIMDKVSDRLHNGDNVKREHLDKIVEFLKNFVDKCHHGKEEGILFPELIKSPTNEKVINELLGEHKSGRDFIRGIAESLENYKPANPDAIHIAVNMQGYIKLLTDHITKENEMFKIVDKQLSDKLQEEMVEKFEELERDVIGEGKHEEYHGWLKELKEYYLT